MNKVREIIRLHESAGLSIRQISKALSVSRPVVDQYLRLARAAELKWAEIEPMDDEQLQERLEALTVRPEDPRVRGHVESPPSDGLGSQRFLSEGAPRVT